MVQNFLKAFLLFKLDGEEEEGREGGEWPLWADQGQQGDNDHENLKALLFNTIKMGKVAFMSVLNKITIRITSIDPAVCEKTDTRLDINLSINQTKQNWGKNGITY